MSFKQKLSELNINQNNIGTPYFETKYVKVKVGDQIYYDICMEDYMKEVYLKQNMALNTGVLCFETKVIIKEWILNHLNSFNPAQFNFLNMMDMRKLIGYLIGNYLGAIDYSRINNLMSQINGRHERNRVN